MKFIISNTRKYDTINMMVYMIYVTGDTHDIKDGILNIDEEDRIFEYNQRHAVFRKCDILDK